jgi:hypothetical protein
MMSCCRVQEEEKSINDVDAHRSYQGSLTSVYPLSEQRMAYLFLSMSDGDRPLFDQHLERVACNPDETFFSHERSHRSWVHGV